jgi:DNA-binding MarR family transcriptional regulator
MAGRQSDNEELTDELGWLIPRTRRLVFNHAHARLEHVGASMFLWPLLRRITSHGALSQLELARLTAQHPAAVCRSLEELERRRLVRRQRDARDRRRVLVTATPRGHAYCLRLHPEVLLGVNEALRPLSRTERTTLRDLLRKLVATAADEPGRKVAR